MVEVKSKTGTGVAPSPFNPIKVEIILWTAFGFSIWGLSEVYAPSYTLGSLFIYSLCFSARIIWSIRRLVQENSN